MKSIKDILAEKDFSKARYNRYEFQAFGNLLAEELRDTKHRALYIKLAKKEDRKILEKAREAASGANLKSGSRAKIFMWKLKILRDEAHKK